jgi:hypothetical protein
MDTQNSEFPKVQDLREVQKRRRSIFGLAVAAIAVIAITAYLLLSQFTVTGQAYIVTRGAGSYKLGGLKLMIYDRSKIATLLSLQQDAAANPPKDMDEHAALVFLRGETVIFLQSLPAPSQTVETDADGHFHFTVSKASDWVVVGHAERDLVGSIEDYFWVVPVPSPTGTSLELNLNNDNMTSTKGGGSLLYTPKFDADTSSP